MCTPFSPAGLARECLYYSQSVLIKDETLKDSKQSEVQNPAGIEIYRSDAGKEEIAQNVSSSKLLKTVEAIYILYGQQQ